MILCKFLFELLKKMIQKIYIIWLQKLFTPQERKIVTSLSNLASTPSTKAVAEAGLFVRIADDRAGPAAAAAAVKTKDVPAPASDDYTNDIIAAPSASKSLQVLLVSLQVTGRSERRRDDAAELALPLLITKDACRRVDCPHFDYKPRVLQGLLVLRGLGKFQ